MNATQTMLTRIQTTIEPLTRTLKSLLSKYGEQDEIVLAAAKALERRFKLESYLVSRIER